MPNLSDTSLYSFISEAGKNTYPAGKPEEKHPERKDFVELTYSSGDLNYRDSFVAGDLKSAGMELVRHKGKPIWYSNYGGGVVDGQEALAKEAISFLKEAFLHRMDDPAFQSFRGPRELNNGDWRYKYKQEGNVNWFNGSETIKFKGGLVFYHKVFGGRIY